jgi:membrane protein
MLKEMWILLKQTVLSFIDDNALGRGASIAFYAVTSLAPILLIVVAIAGLVFGEDAARNALAGQFQSLMGAQSAELMQSAIQNAGPKSSGILATIIGVVTLIVTASGVFGEMQSALNTIWKASPRGTTVSRLIRARAASLGLVAALGFLLLISLVISAVLSALGDYMNAALPFGGLILKALNVVISFTLIAFLFAAIYKVLPDKELEWRDVIVGAVVTSLLFSVGKSLIGWYLGTSAIGSTYGAAGSLMVVLLWVYYSSQIFLLGAEFTHVYACRHGSQRNAPAYQAATGGKSTAPGPAAAPGWMAVALGILAAAYLREIWGRRHTSTTT